MMPTEWYDKEQLWGRNDHTYYTDGVRIRNFFWVQLGLGWIVLYFLTAYVPMRGDFDLEDRLSKRLERHEIAQKIKQDKAAAAEKSREEK